MIDKIDVGSLKRTATVVLFCKYMTQQHFAFDFEVLVDAVI